VYWQLDLLLNVCYVIISENKGNWFIPLEEIVKGPLAQNDSRLLNYLNAHEYLRPPSGLPYNLTEPTQEDPSMGQSKLVRHALNDLKNGFFVECGALDGELRSNTLVLERKLGWNVFQIFLKSLQE